MMPLAALAGSLVVVSFGGLASYFDISRGYGDASLFFRQVGGVWPALLVAAVVALALATSTISTRARTAMIAAAVLTAIPTGIGYLVFVWSRLFGDSGQFRQIFQDLVGPTGQALLLCVAAGVAAIMAISNRDKALSIITLGLVGAPALGILSSRRLWGSLPPIGLMDQLAVLLSGFSSALAAGLLFASVANALRPTNSQIRLGIAIAAGVTLGAVLLRSLAGAIGDGEARFAGFFPADSHITLVLCAVALILSLLSLKPQTKAA